MLAGRFVATQPWYDKDVFQVLLAVLLGVVVVRMVAGGRRSDSLSTAGARRGTGALAGIGAAAGGLASLAGIGGGVVLVPLFHSVVRLPMKVASGTSTAAITLITAVGVATYVVLGLGQPVPDGALGFVDWRGAAALALPAIVTARVGVATAHRVNVRVIRYSFARRRGGRRRAPGLERGGLAVVLDAPPAAAMSVLSVAARALGLASLLTLAACGAGDKGDPAVVTLDGEETLQADDLQPEEIAPPGAEQPPPDIAPDPSPEPEGLTTD